MSRTDSCLLEVSNSDIVLEAELTGVVGISRAWRIVGSAGRLATMSWQIIDPCLHTLRSQLHSAVGSVPKRVEAMAGAVCCDGTRLDSLALRASTAEVQQTSWIEKPET